MSRRPRGLAVMGFLVAGGVGMISSTQPWLTVTRRDGGETLEVTGAAALPLLAPLSLAILALGAALAIVGLVVRYVFAAVAGATAILLLSMTVPVAVSPPLSAAASSITEATGLAGDRALNDVVDSIAPTLWPPLVIVCWALLLASAVYVLLTARLWTRGDRRYRADTASRGHGSGPLDPVDSWDELSHGTDPTESSR